MERLTKKVVLLGGGPSCSAAAVQLVRAQIDVLMITKEIGGLIRNANFIENFLGFPQGITGEEYIALMKKQLDVHNVPVLLEEVERVEREEDKILITTTNNVVETSYVVIGSGTTPRTLKIKGEDQILAEGRLFYEISNLRPLARNKDIIIIGSGDAAYDYALNLSKSANSVKILQRSETTRSLILLQERVNKQEKITVHHNYRVSEIGWKEDKIEAKVECEEQTKKIRADYLLVAIGREPNLAFLSEELREKSCGQLENVNIYLIGDVRNEHYRQISIALGDGIKTAMQIAEKLQG